MRVRVEDQVEDAKISYDPNGDAVVTLKAGLISARAFVALGLALEPLVAHCDQYLQNAG